MEEDSLEFRKDGLVFRRGEVLFQPLQRGSKGLNQFRCRAVTHTTPCSALMPKNFVRMYTETFELTSNNIIFLRLKQ